MGRSMPTRNEALNMAGSVQSPCCSHTPAGPVRLKRAVGGTGGERSEQTQDEGGFEEWIHGVMSCEGLPRGIR